MFSLCSLTQGNPRARPPAPAAARRLPTVQAGLNQVPRLHTHLHQAYRARQPAQRGHVGGARQRARARAHAGGGGSGGGGALGKGGLERAWQGKGGGGSGLQREMGGGKWAR